MDNLYYLVNLDNIEKTLFFIILSKMDYKNVIFFDRSLRKAIIDSKLIARTSLYPKTPYDSPHPRPLSAHLKKEF